MLDNRLRFSDFVTVCWLITNDIIVADKHQSFPWAARNTARVARLKRYAKAFIDAAIAHERGVRAAELPLLAEHLAFARALAPRTEDPDGWMARWDSATEPAAAPSSSQLELAFG